MCDTLFIPGSLTHDGISLFAKNSDREANEAQYLYHAPRHQHTDSDMVTCTYITIPQAAETHAILLSRPFWMWGGEMGTNEHGLAIGNEAVFSKIPEEKEQGLIGMDLLRLALERAKTARQALDIITSLLEVYGQGGSGGYTHHFYYDNSFLIADPQEAWVLETAGRHWVAEKVTGIRTISNGHTIGERYDLISPDAIAYATDRGWHKQGQAFNFARSYADFINTRFSRSAYRQCRTTDGLKAVSGSATIADVMALLRDHGTDNPGHNPLKTSPFTFTVCGHAGWGPVRQAGQSTASMVSHLAPDLATHFFTASSAPCTGVFKPFWVDAGLPEMGPIPSGTVDDASFWWQHERLHRRVMENYPQNMPFYKNDRDSLESTLMSEAMMARGVDMYDRKAISSRAFAVAWEAELSWLERVKASQAPRAASALHGSHWKKLNAAAGFQE